MSVTGRSRQVLIHGLSLVMVGLVWGIFVPSTPYPRLALVAHIQFTSNGLLYVVLATLLLTLRHDVGPRSSAVMVGAAWLTWPMLLSQVANAWWGTQEMLPIAAQQAGAHGAAPWQELVLTVTHALGGLAIVIAWGLLIAGFLRRPSAHAA